MSQRIYTIRKAFLIPFTVDVVLLFVLLVISLFLGGAPAEKGVLAVIFLPMFLIFLEARFRSVFVGDRGIRLKKFLRTKDVDWEDITHVGALIIRNKVYLLLTTVKGFFILSNAYEKFPLLIRDIVEHTGQEKVEEEVRGQMEHPPVSWENVIAAWIAAAVIAGIIFMKLFPF
jgi:hypothetical protein